MDRWERRQERQQAERRRWPVHGKTYVQTISKMIARRATKQGQAGKSLFDGYLTWGN